MYLRTKEIFDIIIDFPDSMGALQGLRVLLPYITLFSKSILILFSLLLELSTEGRSTNESSENSTESVSFYKNYRWCSSHLPHYCIYIGIENDCCIRVQTPNLFYRNMLLLSSVFALSILLVYCYSKSLIRFGDISGS